MNTQTLNNYKLEIRRDLSIISVAILNNNSCEYLYESTIGSRERHEVTISEVEEYCNILLDNFKNEYNKKLIIKYINIVGIKGFRHHGNSSIQRIKKLTNFDIICLLNNGLKSVDDILGSSTNKPLLMGVGKYTNFTKAYIPMIAIKTTIISFRNENVSNKNNHFEINEVLNMKYDAQFTMHESDSKLLYCNQSNTVKMYNGNPLNNSKSRITKLGVKLLDLVFCYDCKTYHKIEFDTTSDCCTHCEQYKVKYKIQSYSHKPTPRFFRKSTNGVRGYINSHMDKNVYFGIEIETSIKRKHMKDFNMIASDVQSASEFNGKPLFYAKYDGSLGNGGVEFVSHPITPNAIQSVDWDDMMSKFRNQIQSFNDDNCGIHIHMSRNFMSDLTMYKFMKIMYKNKSFTELIAQRNTDNWAKIRMSHFNKFASVVKQYKNETNSQYKKFVKANFGQRYNAMNFTNSATIECRIFKGNLKSNMLLKNVEYLLSLKEFCQNTSIQNCELNQYIGFVKSNFKSYPNLNQFLNKNNQQMKSTMEVK